MKKKTSKRPRTLNQPITRKAIPHRQKKQSRGYLKTVGEQTPDPPIPKKDQKTKKMKQIGSNSKKKTRKPYNQSPKHQKKTHTQKKKKKNQKTSEREKDQKV